MFSSVLARLRATLSGFWAVPGLVATALAALALLLITVDRSAVWRRTGLWYSGDASAARDVLSTLAGSMMTR